ncbi:MAG: methionyl-tRNA formyltransferase [Thermoflexibacter sp.]|nr:methionyl-tRNA formyltransferase [Thermoflexibacter sp.]
MKNLRIIFMGTPDFAVPALEILIQNNYNVVAVVTATDKEGKRGSELVPSPVKKCALKYEIPILQPEKLKNPDFIDELASYKADLQIVVAFRMLPEVVWAMPPLGTFNLHASLLPQYRGAAPINWAIINGEKETGITTFFLQHEIDTGDLILQEKEPIYHEDTIGTLYERLMLKGAGLVLKTVQLIESEQVKTIPQSQVSVKDLKLAPKIFKETCQINFAQSAHKIYDFVRGLSPIPTAWAIINGKSYKINQVTPFQKHHHYEVATFETDQKSYLYIYTPDGYISIEEIQAEGKRMMDIGSFLRGNKL